MLYLFIGVFILIVIVFFVSKNKSKKDKKNKPIKRKVVREIIFRGDSKNYVRKIEETDNPNWEKIYRKSEKWFEMGYEKKFPGYGKLYNRLFDVWYCDVGSKEKKDRQSHKDTFPEHYTPDNYEAITKNEINFEKLANSKDYKLLFSGLDNKNRKRWYFGIKKLEPTGIEIISL